MNVTISANGNLRYIWDDELGQMLRPLNNVRQIARASHVEPTDDGKWIADMGPVGGGILGPFDNRADALRQEVAYLRYHLGL
ncbi:MAG: hypothetical protein KDD44_06435 [Bdellovibrionales bacterium]|nr:hypothetical protein [Bdellovibrionales bacterium]